MKTPAQTLLRSLLLLSATALCVSASPSILLPEAANLAVAPLSHDVRSHENTPLHRLKSRQLEARLPSSSSSSSSFSKRRVDGSRLVVRAQSGTDPVAAKPAGESVDADPRVAFLGALRGAQLSAFADLLQNQTDFILADGSEKVVLAMTNEAVQKIAPYVRRDASLLQATLLQHVLVGTFPDLPSNLTSSQNSRIHTVGYSMLSQGSFANLPGGNGQPVALSGSRGATNGSSEASKEDAATMSGNGKGFINEALNDVKLRGDSFKVGLITIVPILRPITVPGTLQYTLDHVVGGALHHSSPLFTPALLKASKKNGTGIEKLPAAYPAAVSARVTALSETTGLTIFVPATAAVMALLSSEAGRALLNTSSSSKKGGPDDAVGGLLTILGQHAVEGRTLYSPLMRDLCDDTQAPPVTTSSGQILTFKCSWSGSGSGRGVKYPTAIRLFRSTDKERKNVLVSANLVQTDIMFANGVIHLIDAVLFSLDADRDGAVGARSAALRKARSNVRGALDGLNCGDGGLDAGSALGPGGVMRPTLGQVGHGPAGNGSDVSSAVRLAFGTTRSGVAAAFVTLAAAILVLI
ncbi:unnamed protein product [Tilletia controversa]|nr:unnamed protein product [Tilletia controversa]CAD6985390.1 unnamed protein product [Tilletia controversa]